MALSVEAAELVEHFQWLNEKQSENLNSDQLHAVGEEAADVFLYLLHLCNRLNIDLLEAAQQKMYKNALKYPIDQVKGIAKFNFARPTI